MRTNGNYNLAGVPPGSYLALVLPLSLDVNSGIYTLDDFGGWACGYGENTPPCCIPPGCGPSLTHPTNYTRTFH